MPGAIGRFERFHPGRQVSGRIALRAPQGSFPHKSNSLAVPNAQNPGNSNNNPVCTENLIRVDDVMESPKLAE